MRIRDRIAKLIDVKTAVTFSVTGLFIYLGAMLKISPDKVCDAFFIIIGFYFGTQHEKKNNLKEQEEKDDETQEDSETLEMQA